MSNLAAEKDAVIALFERLHNILKSIYTHASTVSKSDFKPDSNAAFSVILL